MKDGSVKQLGAGRGGYKVRSIMIERSVDVDTGITDSIVIDGSVHVNATMGDSIMIRRSIDVDAEISGTRTPAIMPMS